MQGDNIYTFSEAGEQEEWGDDELTALDLSAAFLLERADWTTYFNQKGFDGSYPFLLYAHDDADVLNDRLLSEVNRTQVLTGRNKLQIDLFTRFADTPEGKVIGLGWLAVSGMRSISPDLKEDLLWLFCSGASEYLCRSYSTHGKSVRITWYERKEGVDVLPLFDGKEPPKANLERAEYIRYAVIIPEE